MTNEETKTLKDKQIEQGRKSPIRSMIGVGVAVGAFLCYYIVVYIINR